MAIFKKDILYFVEQFLDQQKIREESTKNCHY